jgi:hypothetical protein
MNCAMCKDDTQNQNQYNFFKRQVQSSEIKKENNHFGL